MAFLRHCLLVDGFGVKKMWYLRSARRGTATTKRRRGAHRARADRERAVISRVDEKEGKD